MRERVNGYLHYICADVALRISNIAIRIATSANNTANWWSAVAKKHINRIGGEG